jgi:hypothetical protein
MANHLFHLDTTATPVVNLGNLWLTFSTPLNLLASITSHILHFSNISKKGKCALHGVRDCFTVEVMLV